MNILIFFLLLSLVKVKVLYVVPHWIIGESAVVLKDEKNGRILPIFIGECEAMGIRMALKGEKTKRPLTYELFEKTIKRLGGKIKRVIITDLKNGIYYAVIEMKQKKKTFRIDSRPSDAIALALRFKAPIFVREEVFLKYSIERAKENPEKTYQKL